MNLDILLGNLTIVDAHLPHSGHSGGISDVERGKILGSYEAAIKVLELEIDGLKRHMTEIEERIDDINSEVREYE